MVNDYRSLKESEMYGVVSLTAVHCESGNSRGSRADEAAKRWLMTAGQLSDDAFLGLWFAPSSERRGQALAFTSEEGCLTAEDYRWIFRDVSEVKSEPKRGLLPMWEEGQRIYALQINSENGEIFGSSSRCGGYQDEILPFSDIYRELCDIHAIAVLLTGRGSSRWGMLLIITPSELSVRTRTMFSIRMKDTVLADVTDATGALGEEAFLPMECMKLCAADFLGAFIDSCSDQTEEQETEWDPDAFLLDDFETEETPLEDLELSVRSFNCLKRAGVYTVEQLRSMTDEQLMRIRHFGKKNLLEIREKLAKSENPPKSEEPSAFDYFALLDSLIGLKEVKSQVRKIAAYARMKRDMAAKNKNDVSMVLNMTFVGNPGTAKTTVARILAGILFESGLLKSSDPLEVGRADLVGKYVGHTADKVRNVFDDACGRLLFIDEAYALVDSRRSDFGDEAINTIVQEMENRRSDTIVVFAGYPDEMEEFFSRNPGLRSRVPFHITFPDYSAEEMVRITELEAENRGFTVSPAAREAAVSICKGAVCSPESGNGRFCRNLVENAILNYALRLYGEGATDGEKDFILTAADFAGSDSGYREKTVPSTIIGFCA